MAKIVVAISNKENLEELRKALSQARHQVVQAKDTAPLRAQVSVQNPDLIIADEFLVEENGDELKKLFPDKPLICWMGRRDAKAAVELINAGAFDCISPPVIQKEIAGVVEYALKRTKVVEHEEPFLLKYSKYFTYAAAGLLLLLAASLAIRSCGEMRREKTFELTFQNPTSVFFSGGRIFVSDWYTQSVYEYGAGMSLKLRKTYYFQGNNPYSAAFIGKLLWISDTGGNVRRYELEGGDPFFHSAFKTPGLSFTGLTVQDNYLWSADAEGNMIYQHPMSDPEKVIARYNYPGIMPIGLHWDGRHFWSADGRTGKIYRHYGPEKDFGIIATYTLVPQGGGSLAGLSGDRENLWLVFTGQPAKAMRYPINKLR